MSWLTEWKCLSQKYSSLTQSLKSSVVEGETDSWNSSSDLYVDIMTLEHKSHRCFCACARAHVRMRTNNGDNKESSDAEGKRRVKTAHCSIEHGAGKEVCCHGVQMRWKWEASLVLLPACSEAQALLLLSFVVPGLPCATLYVLHDDKEFRRAQSLEGTTEFILGVTTGMRYPLLSCSEPHVSTALWHCQDHSHWEPGGRPCLLSLVNSDMVMWTAHLSSRRPARLRLWSAFLMTVLKIY